MSIQVDTPLLIVALLVGVTMVWYFLRIRLTREHRERPREVDRYLLRTDLADGASPENPLEWLIALITTRRKLVHGVLLGGTLSAAILAWILGFETLAVILGFGAFLFLVFGSIFVVAPILETAFQANKVDQLLPLQSMSTGGSSQQSSRLVPADGRRTVDRPAPHPSNLVDAKIGIIYAVFIILLITGVITLLEGVG